MPYLCKLTPCVLFLCLLLPASSTCAGEKAHKVKQQPVITQQMQEEWQAYERVFREHMKEHWLLPPRANRRKLQAAVMVAVAKDGKIMETTISESSGDRLFDSSLLRALQQVGELPPPPGNKGLTIMAIFEQ